MREPREYETDARDLYRSERGARASTPWHDQGRDSRGPGEGEPARRQPPAGRPQRRWGSLPAGRGVVIVISATVIGTTGTVLAGQEPGLVLGLFLVAGSVAAALAVQLRAAYLLIPAPALVYVITGSVAGLLHDRAVDTSHTALAVSATQWIASGFLSMSAATVLVITVAIARWLVVRHDAQGPGVRPRVARANDSRRDDFRDDFRDAVRHRAESDADNTAAESSRPARRARRDW